MSQDKVVRYLYTEAYIMSQKVIIFQRLDICHGVCLMESGSCQNGAYEGGVRFIVVGCISWRLEVLLSGG